MINRVYLKMKLLIYLILFIILMQISNGVLINEIMADTLDDQYNEWIEIYNNDGTEINVSNWIIGADDGN